MNQASNLRKSFDAFLKEVVALSDGVVDPAVLRSGEAVTDYTAKAEMISAGYTGSISLFS